MRRVVLDRAAVIADYISGETVNGIARRLGVGRGTIWRVIDAEGVARRTGPVLLDRTITIPIDTAMLGYIAGLFDGEGNLYWRRRTARANSARIAIYNTNAAVMEWLVATLGGHLSWKPRRNGWKTIGVWEVNRHHDVAALLTALMPYLIVKRDAAAAVLVDLARVRNAA